MKLEHFEDMAARARQAPPIRVDVEDAVLRRLAATGAPRESDATLWSSAFACLAGAGALAASLVCVLAAQAWSSLTNPLAGLMNFWLRLP
jgi:hypothetical protein